MTTTENSGYPLFGAPFNDVTDYGFDNDSLITSFLKEKQRPSIHENCYWKCRESYCLYCNKDACYDRNQAEIKSNDYVQSNPIDIMNTASSDFICHSTGCNQNLLRICKWKDKQINNHEIGQLKHGYTFDQIHQIEGITHCHDYFNDETIILSWNRYKAIYLGMKSADNEQNEYKFDVIEEFEPSSNATFKSGIICPLPFVWNSGAEDSVFFTSNGSLIFSKNNGDKNTLIDLKYKEIPPWTELIWTQHPRIIRFSSDIELLTIDLRLNMNAQKLMCAQKHFYFDPITAINSYKHYISTVGLQGLAVYDDRMLKKPLSKWRFYDFDFSIGDGVFSRIQIYPLQNDENGEHWIICSGRSQRVWIYPFFAKSDTPIKSTMPFNINKYTQCFGTDTQINSVLACHHKNNHHIIVTSQYGSMLCTQFELTECEGFDEQKYNIWNDHMFNKDADINDDIHLMELQNSLRGKKKMKANVVYNKWSQQIEDTLLNDNRYKKITDQSKIIHLTQELQQYANDILQFTQIPRTIEEIRNEFEDILQDLQGLTLFDYFCVFKESDIGLYTFQVESITNIDDIADDELNENILNVIITYFVSQRLDEREYIPIEDIGIDNDLMDDDDAKQEILDETQKENDMKKLKEQEKDELNLDEFFELSQIAETQESEPVFDSFPIYNDSSGHLDELGQINNTSFQETRLFNTNSIISDECQNLLDSLCDQWIKGEDNYVIGDWKILNGTNIDYNGMSEKRGSAPKRMKRGPKRVW